MSILIAKPSLGKGLMVYGLHTSSHLRTHILLYSAASLSIEDFFVALCWVSSICHGMRGFDYIADPYAGIDLD